MVEPHARRLLEGALEHLRSFRAALLESRSGAASQKEQQALAVQKLIREIEQTLANPETPASST